LPVITGGDETRAFLLPLTVLRRFDDELKGVFHEEQSAAWTKGTREKQLFKY